MEMRPTAAFRLSYALLLPLLSAFTLSQALDTPPQVECLESAMRLHFVPGADDGASLNSSFSGHIYVKGFFFSTRCHLSFVRIHMDQPFFFHVPYESDCQVTRERVQREPSHIGNDSSSPSGFRYSTVVIVQHHPLFVTDRDRAYGVSCFYNDERHTFQQQLLVGNLPTIPLTGVDRLPTCSYKILPMANSLNYEDVFGVGVFAADASSMEKSIKFANIGDPLVHRWRCNTDGSMGILVHSCVVRDGIGGQYLLLDERGCATDPSLMGTPRYNDALDASAAPMDAFKFAEQMVVQFACKITLCERRENGCEGITPPTCNLSAPTALIREVLSREDIANSPDGRGGYDRLMSTLQSGQSLLSGQDVDGLAFATASPSAVSSVTERWTSSRADADAPSINLFGSGGGATTFAASRHARSARDAFSTGLLGRSREFSAAFPGRGFSKNVIRDVDAAESVLPSSLATLNVSAERMIIFTDDEKVATNADGLKLGGASGVCKQDAAGGGASATLLFLMSALTLLLSASLVVLGAAFAHHLRREIVHHDQRKPTSGMGGRFLQRLAFKHRGSDCPNAGLDNPIALYQMGASNGRTVAAATFAEDPMCNDDVQRASRPYTAAAVIVASSRHRSTSQQQLVVG